MQRHNETTRLGGVFFVPLVVVLALVAAAVVVGMPLVSATPQPFTDIVLELVASFGYTNKSGELALFWGCLGGASLLMVALALLVGRQGRRSPAAELPDGPAEGGAAAPTVPHAAAQSALRAVALLVIPNALLYVVMGQVSLPLLLLAVLYLAVLVAAPEAAEKALLLAVFTYYAICGCIAAGNFVGLSLRRELSGNILLLATAVVSLGLLAHCLWRQRAALLRRAILVLQCLLPLCLTIFLIDRYLYDGGYHRVAYPPLWYVVIGLGMAGLTIAAIRGTMQRWNEEDAGWQRLILLPTLITLFVFNSYILPARNFQSDTHHHGEQMLPWQQLVTQGLTAYQDFAPASGLFPMVIGFFQNVLLGGTTTAYPAALSLTSAVFAAVTIVLCDKAAGRGLALAMAFLFSVPVYDRQYMVLPVLLLLSLPKLIENRALWLPAWVLCCFAAGLYYPLYGAALLAGTLPFGLVQLVAFIRTGDLKQAVKRPKTWLVWGACLAPIALCAPLLLRMARHTLLFSGESVLADGISIFGAPVNDNFLPWLSQLAPGVRMGLFYAFKYAVPILGVLLFLYCTVLYLAGGGGTLWQKLQHPAFFCFSCGVGVLAVSYTFTSIREDYFTVLARVGPILVSVLGIFFTVALHRYGHLILTTGAKHALMGLVLGVAIYAVNNSYMINFPSPDATRHQNGGFAAVLADSDAKKLVYAHEVPEGYLRAEPGILEQYPRLGEGFIAQAQLEQLDYLHAQLGEFIEKDYYVANISGRQMYYYTLNAKAAYNGTWSLFKSTAVQNDVIRWMEAHPNTVGFEITPFTNYVLYHYLTAQRQCVVVDGALWMFPEEAEAGGYEERLSPGEYPFYSYYVSQMDLGNYAGALGNSMAGLAPRFEPSAVEAAYSGAVAATALEGGSHVLEGTGARLEYSLSAPQYGMDADYLYLELESDIDLAQDEGQGRMVNLLTPNRRGDEYKVTVYWASEAHPEFDAARSLMCNYGDGRLLIALGSNPAWLFEDNLRLAVEFGEGFEAGRTVTVKEMALMRYKLS